LLSGAAASNRLKFQAVLLPNTYYGCNRMVMKSASAKTDTLISALYGTISQEKTRGFKASSNMSQEASSIVRFQSQKRDHKSEVVFYESCSV